MHLSSQPALKVRLAASSKRDGNERAWVVNAAPAAAAVWAERTCEVAVSSVLARAILKANGRARHFASVLAVCPRAYHGAC